MAFSKGLGCSFFSFNQSLTKFCLPKVLVYVLAEELHVFLVYLCPCISPPQYEK